MQTGSDVYRQIADRVTAAEGEVARAGELVRTAQQQLQQARAEEARRVAELARVRLGELAASRLTSGLDEADQQALGLLRERERRHDQLQAEIGRAQARQQEAAAARHRSLQARDEAVRAVQEQTAGTMQRLAKDQAYQLQRAHVERLTGLAASADAKADQAEADRERKRQPYEHDKLFAYLWRRRYRFPGYRALPLVAALDGWVARLCRYEEAHRDYGLLLEIPARLRQHAANLAGNAKGAADELAAREQAALAADGVPALEAAVAARQQELDAAERTVATAEDAHAALLARRAELDAGSDEHSTQALEVVVAQLRREDVQTLQRDAAATPTAADDELVRAIAAVRARQQQLAGEVEAAAAPHQQAQRALAELQDLRRRFRQQGFDAEHSWFESFDLGGILGGILRGTLAPGTGWAQVRRYQRFLRPTSSGGAVAAQILGGLLRSAGRGGFGGGGFRTGGGFGGGGGGFRTGGGF